MEHLHLDETPELIPNSCLEEILRNSGILPESEMQSFTKENKPEERSEAVKTDIRDSESYLKNMETASSSVQGESRNDWSPLPYFEEIDKAMAEVLREENENIEYVWSPLPAMAEIDKAMEEESRKNQPEDSTSTENEHEYVWSPLPAMVEIDKVMEEVSRKNKSEDLASTSNEQETERKIEKGDRLSESQKSLSRRATPKPRKRNRDRISCHVCGRSFTSYERLLSHHEVVHQSMHLQCGDCGKRFNSSKLLAHHRLLCSLKNEPSKKKRKTTQVGRGKRISMQENAETQNFEPVSNHDILPAFAELEPKLVNYLNDKVDLRNIKWYLIMHVVFKKPKKDETNGNITSEYVYEDIFQGSQTFLATLPEDIAEDMPGAIQKLNGKFQDFQREGSGWTVDHVVKIEVHTATYDPMVGSSFLPLPTKLRKTKSIINIRNNDNKCFIWAVLAHLFPAKDHKNRVSNYTNYEQRLDTSNLTYPVTLSQIKYFEQKNKLRINVFGFNDEEEKIVPIRLSRQDQGEFINLCLISQEDVNHYCLITNFSGLMNRRRTKHTNKMFYCFNCLHGFTKERDLKMHSDDCNKNPSQRLSFPLKKNDLTIQFRNKQRQQPLPFVIYADLECFTQKIDDDKKYQHHIPNSFGYVVVSCVPEFSRTPVLYRGENAIEMFLEKMMEEEERIANILSHPEPINMTKSDIKHFENSSVCSICGNELLDVKRARDHCHMTGKYRGAAHISCNLNYRFLKKQNINGDDSYVIPIVFHNLRGYDSHHIMEALGKYKDRRIQVIPNTLEKYVSFSLGNLRFIDSLQFMGTSLDKLVQNLAKEGKQSFSQLIRNIPNEEEQDLLLRKGIYPYDYVDEPSKFTENSLPSKENFFSILNDQEISNDDYTHANSVWNAFHCQNFGDYHDLYLKSDVLQLADVFENFRQVCQRTYDLDPAHYFTAPGLSWDAMLKHTDIKLDLITDIDMYLMVEKGIRGGVSMISNKYAKANNPYVPGHNPNEPNNYILYLDANNLYGWAMTQSLPKGDFKWVDNLEGFDVLGVSEDSNTGYILEVDMEYPQSLHDHHSDYPLAPERKIIHNENLSPFSQQLLNDLNLTGKPTEKLIPNLSKKEKYVIHYRNLQQYLNLGLKLTKIHRAISFSQSKWLKSYIDLNTDKRKSAQNVFEKDFYKLMNNSVFGKTMENVRKRINVELVHNEKRFRKVVAKPEFHRFKIFNEDLTGVHLKVSHLVLNKPIYVGMSILDLSKNLMYDFHYEFIKKQYDDVQLLMTDTDSLCYNIVTKDIYDDMLKKSSYFDTSDFPVNHFLHSNNNKKVLGKMKDETAGIAIEEFVGLRSKMYSMVYLSSEKKTAKGIGRASMKKVKHTDYKDCLFSKKSTRAVGNIIRSYDHQVYSEIVNKVALSSFDDKRYVLDDGFSTLAHGHYRSVNFL